jgi:hypothetical protein
VILEQQFILPLRLEECLKWPKCLFVMYLLCKALIDYAYFLYGYTEKPKNATPKKQATLEKIQEEEDDYESKTPQFD